jgi:hypothetical protein
VKENALRTCSCATSAAMSAFSARSCSSSCTCSSSLSCSAFGRVDVG